MIPGQAPRSTRLATALMITLTGALGAGCSDRTAPNPDGQPRVDGATTHDGAADLKPGCKAIEDDYLAQYEIARICNPVLSTLQCTKLVYKAVPCPLCSSMMNPANAAAITRLGELAREWQSKGCAVGRVCPAIDCADPRDATCEPTPAGSKAPGLCTNKY